ncbi:FecR domain-containing protein [Acetobacter conturbans]|uniref:FecR domain-containing protein n=1 Tax=Acetobacter conturbans TaxID=1737472 RepID=UPI001568BD3D
MTESRNPDEVAAGWYVYLREEPDDPELRQQFEAWLHESPLHRQAWAEINETLGVLASAPPERRERNSARRWWGRPANDRRGSRRMRTVAFAGAAMAACVAAFVLVPDLTLRLRADHYTQAGTTQAIRLADGSEVILAPRSALTVHMTAHARRIDLLRGEAWFVVHHDTSRPFSVVAGPVTTTDIGTMFDARTDGEETSVAVREGAVHVFAQGGISLDRDLHAGERVDVKGGQVTVDTQSPETMGLWRDGMLVAQGNTIAEMAAALQPWTQTRIIIAHDTLAARKVSGSYDLRHPETSLQLIVHPYGGKVVSVTPWFALVTGR